MAGTAVVDRARDEHCRMQRLDFLPAVRLECAVGRYDAILAHDPEIGVLAVIETRRLVLLAGRRQEPRQLLRRQAPKSSK